MRHLTIRVGVGSMNETLDRVMASYGDFPALDRDTEELTLYGLAYLRILHEGPDPRYTGC
jgi:hypothetical protein